MDLNFLLISLLILSRDARISEASEICCFMGLESRGSLWEKIGVFSKGFSSVLLVTTFEGTRGAGRDFVDTKGGISGKKCVCWTVCLSVCLSVGTPSFPMEIGKFWVFHPPISCPCVGLCVGITESVVFLDWSVGLFVGVPACLTVCLSVGKLDGFSASRSIISIFILVSSSSICLTSLAVSCISLLISDSLLPRPNISSFIFKNASFILI